jgi:hypothetical protein
MVFRTRAALHPDVERQLFTADQISDKVESLGR